jgi:glycosyltransferase involved in cell wall biosynthesis
LLRIFLLDHDLKTVSDSAVSHSLSFAQAFLEVPTAVEIWAHRSCDLDHPAVKRVFQLSQGTINRLANRGKWPVVRKFNHLLVLVRANVSYFISLWQAQFDGDAILFVSNSSPFVVPALQLFGRLNNRAKIVVYFQRPITRFVRVLGTIHKLIRLQNLRYCTEVPTMAERYQSALGLPCHVVPCPLPRWNDREVATNPVAPYLGLVLGGPRQAKGFDIFVDAVKHLAGALQQGRLRLMVQSLPIDQAEPSLRCHVAHLSALSKDHRAIELIERVLTREEYDSVLSQCDFVILPYRQALYSGQSSGIAFEALSHGKPLVMTEGLSFSPTAAAHNAIVEVADGDPVGLADGIERLINELPTYRMRALKVAGELKREHSIGYFSERLISLFGNS